MIDTKKYEELLLAEKSTLEKQLSSIAVANPLVKSDWELRDSLLSADGADTSDTADRIEELEENNALLTSLELRLQEVDAALARIRDGSYGMCELSGTPIEEDRLNANPCARTSKAHIDGAVA